MKIIGMKFIVCYTCFLVLSLFFLSSGCTQAPVYGKLGIRVPVGEGVVSKTTPYIISGVYEGSPAYRAGIQPDDIIIKINNVTLNGMKYQDVYNNVLRGVPQTGVTLYILRKGKKLKFELVRSE